MPEQQSRIPATPAEWASLDGVDIVHTAKYWFADLDLADPTGDEDYKRRVGALNNYDLDNPVFAAATERKLAKIAVWLAAEEAPDAAHVTDYSEGYMYAAEFVAQTYGQLAEEIDSRQKDIDARTGLDRYETFLYKLRQRYESGPRRSDLVEVDGELIQPLLVFAVDGDEFGKINKQYGHAVGDEVIHELAAPLKRLRQDDLKARRGGDEFLAAVGGINRGQAEEVCNRFSTELAEGVVVPLPGGGFIRVTASTAAVFSPHVTTYNQAMEVLEYADKLLIQYKNWVKQHPGQERSAAELVELLFNPDENQD